MFILTTGSYPLVSTHLSAASRKSSSVMGRPLTSLFGSQPQSLYTFSRTCLITRGRGWYIAKPAFHAAPSPSRCFWTLTPLGGSKMFSLNGAVLSSPMVKTCSPGTQGARLLYSVFTGSITRKGTPCRYSCRRRLDAVGVLPKPVVPVGQTCFFMSSS